MNNDNFFSLNSRSWVKKTKGIYKNNTYITISIKDLSWSFDDKPIEAIRITKEGIFFEES